MALLVDGDGQGWALGGWSGEGDAAGRGNAGRTSQGRSDRARVQTGGVYRYSTGAQPPPPAVTRTGVALPGSPARFAIAGHAQCEESCADLRDASIGPDRTLAAAESMVEQLHQQPGGPRMLLYTGGRLPAAQTLGAADADRYAELLTGGAPTYAALSAADSQGGSADAFTSAFAAAPSPFGSGPAPGGVAPVTGLPGGSGRAHPLRVRLRRQRRTGARRRDRQLARLAGGVGPLPEPGRAPGAVAARRARRREGQANPGDRRSAAATSTRASSRASTWPTTRTPRRQLLVDGGASAYFFERPGREPDVHDPERGGDDHPGVRERHAGLPLGAGEHHHRAGCRVRRRSRDARRGRHQQARRDDQSRAGDRAAAAGDLRPHAAGGRWHVAAALAPLAVSGTRPAHARRRPLGCGGRRRRSAAAGQRPVHRAAARPLHRPDVLDAHRARVRVLILGPRHRRLRRARSGVDEPAQAADRRRRQGRHRPLARASSARSTRARPR